jgi:ABC-type multidrug transport system ATPase subunit
LILAKGICDRIAILHRGELQAIGTVEELLAAREHLRLVVDLLSQEEADRVLQVVRQQVGMSDLTSGSPFDALGETLPKMNATSCSTPEPQESVTDTVLAPLVKDAPATETEVSEPTPTVNHEMLAELTKHTNAVSSPALEPKQGSPPAVET